MVPFENSTNGSVIFTLDQFADRDGEYPDLSVCAEIYLDVHHCLLGRFPGPPPGGPPLLHTAGTFGAGAAGALDPSPLGGRLVDDGDNGGTAGEASPETLPRPSPPSPPTVSGQCTPTLAEPRPRGPRSRPTCGLGHVRRVYSHPQAFGQCTRFLATYLRGVETVDVSSTSRAAALAAADPTGAAAALSSAVAAAPHGLDVLARDVEDRDDNTTRFFVLRRGRNAAGPGALAISGLPPRTPRPIAAPAPTSLGEEAEAPAPASKSLLSFTVPHAEPGALAAVLECFRRHHLNLTSIASRPSLRAPFNYVFFVEFEGHRFADPAGRVGAVLADVARVAQSARWLGSWENMRR